MKLFLSYASEDKDQAEQIYYALLGSGYEVFLDRSSLPPSGDYNSNIDNAISESDGFIFLISPDSVDKSSYALTELKSAEAKWRHPKGKVLPILLKKTDFSEIPNYLKSVTVLEPRGNIAADAKKEVDRLFQSGPRKGIFGIHIKRVKLFAAIFLVSVLVVGGYELLVGISVEPTIPSPINKSTSEKNVPSDSTASIDGEVIFNSLHLANTSKRLAPDENSWEWTAFIDATPDKLENIKSVKYILHPSFQPNELEGDPSQPGHPLTVKGWGTFLLKAEVVLKSGKKRMYSHQLVFE